MVQLQAVLSAGSSTISNFGTSVAISADGDVVLLGSPHLGIVKAVGAQVSRSAGTAAAYIFEKGSSGWLLKTTLAGKDIGADGFFGLSVALSGDGHTALIGDVSGRSGGIAYIYEHDNSAWRLSAALISDQPPTSDDIGNTDFSDNFGFSVALSGDGRTALVGAPLLNANSGIVFVFARSSHGWSQRATLTAAPPVSNSFFGASVALSGDGHSALVGAFGQAGRVTGAAYVFEQGPTGWRQPTSLVPPGVTPDDSYGGSVALSGDGRTALVGAAGEAPFNSTPGITGAAYVFELGPTGWGQPTSLVPPGVTPADFYGSAVALSGDGQTALATAPSFNVPPNVLGIAKPVFEFSRGSTGWGQAVALPLPNGLQPGSNFGWGVASSGDAATVVVAAPGPGGILGTAYVFV